MSPNFGYFCGQIKSTFELEELFVILQEWATRGLTEAELVDWVSRVQSINQTKRDICIDMVVGWTGNSDFHVKYNSRVPETWQLA